MKNYTYAVVTRNGAGVYFEAGLSRRGLTRFFEIQRMEYIGAGTRRYQMRQRSRWVPWDPHRE